MKKLLTMRLAIQLLAAGIISQAVAQLPAFIALFSIYDKAETCVQQQDCSFRTQETLANVALALTYLSFALMIAGLLIIGGHYLQKRRQKAV